MRLFGLPVPPTRTLPSLGLIQVPLRGEEGLGVQLLLGWDGYKQNKIPTCPAGAP